MNSSDAAILNPQAANRWTMPSCHHFRDESPSAPPIGDCLTKPRLFIQGVGFVRLRKDALSRDDPNPFRIWAVSFSRDVSRL